MNTKRFQYAAFIAKGLGLLVIFSSILTSCTGGNPAVRISTSNIPDTNTKPVTSVLPSVKESTPGNTAFPVNITTTAPIPTIQVDNGNPLPPKVIRQNPTGGTELPLDGSLEIEFDQPMDQAKTNTSWQIVDIQNQPIIGKLIWNTPSLMHFTPEKPLQSNTTYHVTINTQATSQSGLVMTEPFTFQFTTVGELKISKVFPEDGTTDVANNAAITVMFNRPVVPLTVKEDIKNLPSPIGISPEISGSGEWLNTSVYVYHPDKPLMSSQKYTVTVKGGLTDTAGAQLMNDFNWQFLTIAPSIDYFELNHVVTNPADNYNGVLLDQEFTISFRQPMDKNSVEEAFSLESIKREKKSVTFTWTENSKVSIKPETPFDLGTKYVFKLDKNAQSSSGGRLLEGIAWNFTTMLSPGIVETTPKNGSTQNKFSEWFHIQFASQMDLNSLKDKIVVTPTIEQKDNWSYDQWNWGVNFYGLKPSTAYEIHILPGMADKYGHKIEKEYVFRFTTAPYNPTAYLQMPWSTSIYRSDGKDLIFYTRSTNIRSLNLNLYKLTVEEFSLMENGHLSSHNYLPSQDQKINAWNVNATGKINQRKILPFKLEDKQGKTLQPGFYYLTLDSPQTHGKEDVPFTDSRAFIVANANITIKNSGKLPYQLTTVEKQHSSDSLMWITDLTTGVPVENSNLTLYNKDFQPIGQGITDKNGLLSLTTILKPSKNEEQDRALPTYVMTNPDDPHFAFASTQWGSGVSPYDFGIWSDYYDPTEKFTAYLYTDRPIYRPGQPVSFKGIVRWDNDVNYSIPDLKEVNVVIKNFNDETIYNENLPLNKFGTFSGVLKLDQDASLGGYSINAQLPKLPSDNPKDKETLVAFGNVSFTVAEYRKPEFQVKVEANKENVLAGDMFTGKVSTTYYSGGNTADAHVKWALSSEQYYFNPPDDLQSYSFFDNEADSGIREENAQDFKIVSEGEGKTDPNGKLEVPLTADLSDSKTSRKFTFEATVTDISGNEVSGRVSLIAHRSKMYPGVMTQQYVGKINQKQGYDLIVVDWEGKPVADQNIKVEIVERVWHSVQEQNADGSIEWKNSFENVPVKEFTDLKTDKNGKASVAFTPEKGGVFKAIVTVLDDKGNQAKSAAYIWVTGDEFIPWRQTNNRSFDLIADRKEYNSGDTAEILIASPYPEKSYALITIERGRVRSKEVIQLTSNSTIYHLPITEDMSPNVYISVIIIKGAETNNKINDSSGTNKPVIGPDFRIGMKEIKVNPKAKAVKVIVQQDQEQAKPGDHITYTIKTVDSTEKPVSAEVSLALSDLSTLSLVDSNSVPILDHFYSTRNLGVRTSVPIVLNIENYNAEIESQIPTGEGGGGGGGGKGGNDTLGVPNVRENFPDTAFWKADVVTDSNGQGSVTVTLPDNLTTWRMDARAVTEDTHVGQTTSDTMSTKPLLIMPQTPRFFVSGDRLTLGASIHNNTKENISAEATIKAKGVIIKSPESVKIDMAAGNQSVVSWDIQVDTEAHYADLVFQVTGGGYQDASRPTIGSAATGINGELGLPVYRYDVMEKVGTSGMLSGSPQISSQDKNNLLTQTEAIVLPTDLRDSADAKNIQGDLTVKLAPSLAAGMVDGLDYLEHYPYECTEQTISRFLPNILSSKALTSLGISDISLQTGLKQQINVALQRLYKQQNPDGGWGWWSTQKSNLQTSAYVVLGLIEANDAGYTVNKPVIERGLGHLRENLMSVKNLDSHSKLNLQSFILYVLAYAHQADISRTVQLYDDRQSLSLFGRAYLAQTLFLIQPNDERIKTLSSDFSSTAILSANGAHWEETDVDYDGWNTDTRTTAIVLTTMIKIDTQSPLNANAVRWLMSNRTNGHWKTTQETVWSLIGLTDWMMKTNELQSDYQYTTALNGKQLGDAGWHVVSGKSSLGNLQNIFELKVNVADMLVDQTNRLSIARTDGPGNLYYTAYLNVSLPVEKVKPLDQGIVISRAYFNPDDSQKPITKIERGQTVLARLTIVAPNDLRYVVIDDPLPAGLEAIDSSLLTSSKTTGPSATEPTAEGKPWVEDLFKNGWGWQLFDHIELRDEKVVLSAAYLPAGTYTYTYLARASTSGEFRVIPPTAQEFYFPEVNGRGAGSLFEVSSK